MPPRWRRDSIAKQHSKLGTVLITGSSSGIGRACARRLAERGYRVIAGVRSESDAASVEQMGSGTDQGIRAIQIDVTQPASVEQAASELSRIVGEDGLYGLVNNAGTCVVGPVECVSLADWRAQYEVNLFGAIAVSQAVLPLLRRRVARSGPGAARIVNMSSITGRVAAPLFGAYSSSKAALESFSDALRLELREHGIHVCVLVPGTIQSEIWRKEKAGVEAVTHDSRARELYGAMIANVSRYVFKAADSAKPADLVAQAVERCLTKRRPATRTLIAWEAHVGWRAKAILPARFFDFLMCKTLGVPSYPKDPEGTVRYAER